VSRAAPARLWRRTSTFTTGFGGDLITPAQLAELPNIRRVVDKPLSSESIMRLIAELLRPGTPGGPDKA